jgi:hypothetical protein
MNKTSPSTAERPRLVTFDFEHPLIGWLVRRGVSVHRARLAVTLAFRNGRAA